MTESVVCPTCLLRQRPLPNGAKCRCVRCGGRLRTAIDLHLARRKVRAFSLAALLLYPMAIGLPVMRVEKFGHSHETGILRGTFDLLAADEVALALLLFACSIVLPLVKLVGLLLLSSGAIGDRRRGRLAGWLVRLIEGTGRWGMLDVLLVAVLAALVKLGDLVQITAGVGATTFILCVGLSLLASASFDSRLVFGQSPTDEEREQRKAVPS